MANYNIVDITTSTTGKTIAKVEYKGIGTTGYRNLTDDKPSSAQAWAGVNAHEDEDATAETKAKYDVVDEVTTTTPDRREWTEPKDVTDDDYQGDKITGAEKLTIPEHGIHIENYPLRVRADQVVDQMGLMVDFYMGVYVQWRFRIVYHDGNVDHGVMRTKTLGVELGEQMRMEMRQKLNSMRASMDDSPVEAVYIDRTELTGLNYE